MSTKDAYSAKSVYEGLVKTFHEYLRAQYHIWDEDLIDERDKLFEKIGTTHLEPRLESTPLYAEGQVYSKLDIPKSAIEILNIAAANRETGIPKIPYLHQAQALEHFFKGTDDLIVATGTGSGKTESFLMPILSTLAVERGHRPESWRRDGVRALLLYPMNALVNDQMARLRRLLGNDDVSGYLKGDRSRMATFGMYTSRTSYPGEQTVKKDRDRVQAQLEKLNKIAEKTDIKELLLKEGKWPAKDIEAFLKNKLTTGLRDCELLTRQEMQVRSPDVLVTNYSMLEYMMLRPIEANIFDQTRNWLAEDSSNTFIVVLDEAHMYRGSAGAEVAYLLRRLHARLGVPRLRVKYILTSASLGTTETAYDEIKTFAELLTGAKGSEKTFHLVSGTLLKREIGGAATKEQLKALSDFNFDILHRVSSAPSELRIELSKLYSGLAIESENASELPDDLRDAAYGVLTKLPVARSVASAITARPTTLATLSEALVPIDEETPYALESLLALMAFGKDLKSGISFAPIRTHLFFRGLPGLYACTNASCEFKGSNTKKGPLGKLFATSRMRCDCKSRVYELLTHRTCGAAYLRGYLTDPSDNFIWHEQTNGVWSDRKLVEAHFYVVLGDSTEALKYDPMVWLRTSTGELSVSVPNSTNAGEYLALLRPCREVVERGQRVYTVDCVCPACKQSARRNFRAMDLATKGEDPFAHLVRTQVALQPQVSALTRRSPNGGRKSLLFSDGRQKAARLARDIPRAIESDVFRQILVLAATQLTELGQEPSLGSKIYTSFIAAVEKCNLQMFDGDHQKDLQQQVEQFRDIYKSDLADALEDGMGDAPAQYYSLLLKQLCHQYYSVISLTLAYLLPTKKAMRHLASSYPSVSEDQMKSLVVPWITRLLRRFAYDKNISAGVRRDASQYPSDPIKAIDVFSKEQRAYLEGHGFDVIELTEKFKNTLCDIGVDGGIYLIPGRLTLHVAINDNWHQCSNCRAVLATCWWDACSNCLSTAVTAVDPNQSSYLRSRKGFWRNPVIAIATGLEKPMNLIVEEHTAQLSHKDAESSGTTTEEFERRFRDILIDDSECSIDVLSSTTTMEVGIDIGSLVAVGMRNVPPMRQNYQQRAGRAGRRGSSISTVITYAQSGAHDAYYFANADKMIGGDPPKPLLDVGNKQIATRHVHAQLIQDFFRRRVSAKASGDLSSVLGGTDLFFSSTTATGIYSFEKWIKDSPDAKASFASAASWLPIELNIAPENVALELLIALENVRPIPQTTTDPNLIDFLFARGFLPTYAFPRDLCALQIERQSTKGKGIIEVVERPQQSLSIALSEYAPGRLIVVNKKTYRVGSVAADCVPTTVNRAKSLFDSKKTYVHCESCFYTTGFSPEENQNSICPQCKKTSLTRATVIRPEVVFPKGRREVDEFDDEQAYSQTSSAQLPLQASQNPNAGTPFGANCILSFARQQSLVTVNRGPESQANGEGFKVCELCGKVQLEGDLDGAHERDYLIQTFGSSSARNKAKCYGSYREVFLGYSFNSDVLLLRVKLSESVRFDFLDQRKRKPLQDALQSLCDALSLAISRVLDIDLREVSSGFRFASQEDGTFADLFVYDTLSGGAGYAYQSGERFAEIFNEARLLLTACTCDTSCEKCLRHYGNRFHHELLDRNMAIDLVEYVNTGLPPTLIELSSQREMLKPLMDMCEMHGWKVGFGAECAWKISTPGRDIAVALAPSLLNTSYRDIANGMTRYTFTPYELDRDIQSAFAELR